MEAHHTETTGGTESVIKGIKNQGGFSVMNAKDSDTFKLNVLTP